MNLKLLEGHKLLSQQRCTLYHLQRNNNIFQHILKWCLFVSHYSSINLPDAAFGRTVIELSCMGFTLPKSAILICPSELSNRFSGCHSNNVSAFFLCQRDVIIFGEVPWYHDVSAPSYVCIQELQQLQQHRNELHLLTTGLSALTQIH